MGLCTSGKWILVRLSSKILIKQFIYIYMYLIIVLCNLHLREELKFFCTFIFGNIALHIFTKFLDCISFS